VPLVAFRETLIEYFGVRSIVTLKDLTKKIATISKVRVGKHENRTVTDYAEISLQNIDNLGYVYIPKEYKGHPPANHTSIKKQALNYNDIILSFRSIFSQNIALVNKSYDEYSAIVGNNSMIRMEFDEDRREDTPIYVYHFLKLPFVHNILKSLCRVDKSLNLDASMFLSPSILETLPIPIFYEGDGAYKEYIHTRLSILDTFDSIEGHISFLKDNLKDLTLGCREHDSSGLITFSSQAEKAHLIIDVIKEFEKKLESIIEPDTFKEYQENQIQF